MTKLDKLYSDNMFLGHRGMFFSNTPFSNQKLNINQQQKEYSVSEVKKMEKKSLLRLIGSGQGPLIRLIAVGQHKIRSDG